MKTTTEKAADESAEKLLEELAGIDQSTYRLREVAMKAIGLARDESRRARGAAVFQEPDAARWNDPDMPRYGQPVLQTELDTILTSYREEGRRARAADVEVAKFRDMIATERLNIDALRQRIRAVAGRLSKDGCFHERYTDYAVELNEIVK